MGQAMGKPYLRARDLASITGKINSMSLAIGPVSRLMTRSTYSLLSTRKHWNQSLTLTPEVKEEVQFWISQIDLINGKEIWHSPSAVCHGIRWLYRGTWLSFSAWVMVK